MHIPDMAYNGINKHHDNTFVFQYQIITGLHTDINT